MKSSAFVFALLGASVGSALAQSATTVYGVLDAGVVSERGCQGCATRVDSGIASESRLGVRGSEPLGDNLSAVYTLEAGVQLDTGRSGQNGQLFGREANVGISGKAGTVTVGRHPNLEYEALTDVGDPFKGGMAGTATNLIGSGGRRVDNSIQYYSAEVNGVSAAASYGAGEVVGDRRANRAWGVSVGFENGPLTIRAAHQNRNVALVAPSTAMGNNTDAKNSILAANLRVGIATAYVAYSASRGWGSSPLWNPDNPYGAGMASTPSTDSRDVLVGVAVPVGATTLLASYIRKNDRDLANQDANQLAFGATYAMSRRTDFYAAYSRITNRNGAGYTVGNASSMGRGSSALNVGMRHAF
ncbi:MAG: porin [Telluria sp.]